MIGHPPRNCTAGVGTIWVTEHAKRDVLQRERHSATTLKEQFVIHVILPECEGSRFSTRVSRMLESAAENSIADTFHAQWPFASQLYDSFFVFTAIFWISRMSQSDLLKSSPRMYLCTIWVQCRACQQFRFRRIANVTWMHRKDENCWHYDGSSCSSPHPSSYDTFQVHWRFTL